MQIRTLKTFINFFHSTKIKPRNPKDKKYYLIEKIENMPIKNFPQDSWDIPKDAVTFKQVKIGKTKDSEYKRNITSFYNKDNKIIKQFQSGTEIPSTCKEYSYESSFSKNEHFIHIKRIQTEKYLPVSGITDWQKTSDVEQLVNFDLNKKKNYKFSQKLTIKKTKYNINSQGEKFTTTFTEYPFNLGFEPKKNLKILGADIEMQNGIPYIMGSIESPTVKFPENDKFLAFRFLNREQKQEALAKYFLKQNGLERANVEVDTGKDLVPENASAVFSHGYGSIYFKENPQYTSPAKSAAHEAEHAYQYCLIGRLGVKDSEYEKRCFRIFGKIISSAKREEALKYKEAKLKYPKINDSEDLSKNKEYQNNYLEVKAREAGINAKKEYEKGRNELFNQFKYIPNTYYYF